MQAVALGGHVVDTTSAVHGDVPVNLCKDLDRYVLFEVQHIHHDDMGLVNVPIDREHSSDDLGLLGHRRAGTKAKRFE